PVADRRALRLPQRDEPLDTLGRDAGVGVAAPEGRVHGDRAVSEALVLRPPLPYPVLDPDLVAELHVVVLLARRLAEGAACDEPVQPVARRSEEHTSELQSRENL